ncbi:MAG: Hpt domain-containing protein [Butyricicoccus sp.]
MNLEEFYAQIGGDYADTLQRLCNENMVKKFVKKYQDDPTCADLHNAVLQQDWEAAFRGAHTLKGVAQNLGFERLYQVSAVLTEAMRGEAARGQEPARRCGAAGCRNPQSDFGA